MCCCGMRPWPNAPSSATPTKSAARSGKAFVVLRAPRSGDEAMMKALRDFVKATEAP